MHVSDWRELSLAPNDPTTTFVVRVAVIMANQSSAIPQPQDGITASNDSSLSRYLYWGSQAPRL